jgi:hypothetical protein
MWKAESGADPIDARTAFIDMMAFCGSPKFAGSSAPAPTIIRKPYVAMPKAIFAAIAIRSIFPDARQD